MLLAGTRIGNYTRSTFPPYSFSTSSDTIANLRKHALYKRRLKELMFEKYLECS